MQFGCKILIIMTKYVFDVLQLTHGRIHVQTKKKEKKMLVIKK